MLQPKTTEIFKAPINISFVLCHVSLFTIYISSHLLSPLDYQRPKMKREWLFELKSILSSSEKLILKLPLRLERSCILSSHHISRTNYFHINNPDTVRANNNLWLTMFDQLFCPKSERISLNTKYDFFFILIQFSFLVEFESSVDFSEICFMETLNLDQIRKNVCKQSDIIRLLLPFQYMFNSPSCVSKDSKINNEQMKNFFFLFSHIENEVRFMLQKWDQNAVIQQIQRHYAAL